MAMAMLMNFKPLLSISNNNKSSYYVIGRNSPSSRRRLVCKSSSTTNKVLLRRFSGNTDGNPYFTTLSTTTDVDTKGSNCSPIIIQHDDYISLPPFPKTLDYYHNIKVVGSCDGLVCLADGSGCSDYAAIWNPSTNDYKMLPDSSVQPKAQPWNAAFSSWKVQPWKATFSSFSSCGFGFDPKSQDYKMVRFAQDRVEVYSLKTDSWREVSPPNHLSGKCHFTSTTIDGRCNWIVANNSKLILCFDLSTEEFLPLIPFPDAIKKTNSELLEFDGSLALLNCSKCGEEYNVWVLDHSSSSWSHGAVIRHSPFTLNRPIGFMGNDKLLFECKNRGKGVELLVYDCVSRDIKSLGIYEDTYNVFNIVPYNSADDNYSMGNHHHQQQLTECELYPSPSF